MGENVVLSSVADAHHDADTVVRKSEPITKGIVSDLDSLLRKTSPTSGKLNAGGETTPSGTELVDFIR